MNTFSFSYKGYNAAVVAGPGGTGGTFPPNTNVLELQEWGSIVEKFQIFVKFFKIFIKIFLKTFKMFNYISKICLKFNKFYSHHNH